MTAFLDQLAADAVEAADVQGPASPEHDAAMDAFAEAEEEADQQIGPALPGFEELWAAQERAAELTETGTDAEYATAIAERQQTEAAFLQNLDRQLDAALGEPDAAAEHAFYGSHAENGHAARWGPDGTECDSCGEQYRAPALPERRPKPDKQRVGPLGPHWTWRTRQAARSNHPPCERGIRWPLP